MGGGGVPEYTGVLTKKSGFTKNLHQHPAPSAPEGALYTYFRLETQKSFFWSKKVSVKKLNLMSTRKQSLHILSVLSLTIRGLGKT